MSLLVRAMVPRFFERARPSDARMKARVGGQYVSMEPLTPGTNAFLGTTFSIARAKETALSRLRALIEGGDVQTAGRLPPERVLAEQIGVSRRAYEKADSAFHRRIAVAARNPLLVTIFEAVLHVASDRSWRHGRETAHCIQPGALCSGAPKDRSGGLRAQSNIGRGSHACTPRHGTTIPGPK
jgi:Bacterial regulatory proteins, gntR family